MAHGVIAIGENSSPSTANGSINCPSSDTLRRGGFSRGHHPFRRTCQCLAYTKLSQIDSVALPVADHYLIVSWLTPSTLRLPK